MTHDNSAINALVPAAQQGDRAAIRELMRLLYPPVLRYCRARLGEHQLSGPEDVTQDILIAVLHALPRYREEGRPFLAFVYGIAGHKVADTHRAHARNRAEATDSLPEVADGEEGPLEKYLLSESSNKVAALLDGLSERARDIITLRVVAGLSAEDTAQIVGSTPGAVRVAQHRALAKLRTALTEMDTDAS